MSEFLQAAVWIDHRQARVVKLGTNEPRWNVILSGDGSPTHLHHKANSIDSGHLPEDQKYLHEVSALLRDATEILVVGPANEKTELVKHIVRHDPALSSRILEVQPLDQLTDRELMAHARKFFKAAHRMRGQRVGYQGAGG